MRDKRIRNSVTIEFEQLPNGEVRWWVSPDDWVRHYSEMSPKTMGVCNVPLSTIVARIIADMVQHMGVEKAMEYAKRCQAEGVKVRERIKRDSEDINEVADGDAGDSVH